MQPTFAGTTWPTSHLKKLLDQDEKNDGDIDAFCYACELGCF